MKKIESLLKNKDNISKDNNLRLSLLKYIKNICKGVDLNNVALSEKLGIGETEIFQIQQLRIARFSLKRLFFILNNLGVSVDIVLSKYKNKKTYQRLVNK